MKVYAEYIEEDGFLYRRNTFLQFGNSWELIGSAVLANPGSAKPISPASDEILTLVSRFYEKWRKEEKAQPEHWNEFSPDSTMRFVEKIFNGWYIGKSVELNGVIQLFNTFNIKNQNLQEAVTQIGVNSGLLFSYNVYKYFNDKPTYFGFSKEVLDNQILKNVAMSIFSNSSQSVLSLYNSNFDKNKFYHPMYVNQAYGQKHFQKYRDEVLFGILKNA